MTSPLLDPNAERAFLEFLSYHTPYRHITGFEQIIITYYLKDVEHIIGRVLAITVEHIMIGHTIAITIMKVGGCEAGGKRTSLPASFEGSSSSVEPLPLMLPTINVFGPTSTFASNIQNRQRYNRIWNYFTKPRSPDIRNANLISKAHEMPHQISSNITFVSPDGIA